MKDTHLMTDPVVWRSSAICGMQGTNEPEINTRHKETANLRNLGRKFISVTYEAVSHYLMLGIE